MTDTEFLERKLRQIAEERVPDMINEHLALRMQFVNSGRLKSGAQAYAESDLFRRRFTELARAWARLYLKFCEAEGVPIERHLDFVDKQGRRTIADWVDRGRELVSPDRIRDELLKVLDEM